MKKTVFIPTASAAEEFTGIINRSQFFIKEKQSATTLVSVLAREILKEQWNVSEADFQIHNVKSLYCISPELPVPLLRFYFQLLQPLKVFF